MRTGKTDQTGQMPRLIWVFAGCTCHFVGFVMRRLKSVQWWWPSYGRHSKSSIFVTFNLGVGICKLWSWFTQMSHLMRLWYFSSSVNAFFKCTCTAIQWSCMSDLLIYFHTSCVRTAMALVRLCECADSPEPSLVTYVVSTIISLVGLNEIFTVQRFNAVTYLYEFLCAFISNEKKDMQFSKHHFFFISVCNIRCTFQPINLFLMYFSLCKVWSAQVILRL